MITSRNSWVGAWLYQVAFLLEGASTVGNFTSETCVEDFSSTDLGTYIIIIIIIVYRLFHLDILWSHDVLCTRNQCTRWSENCSSFSWMHRLCILIRINLTGGAGLNKRLVQLLISCYRTASFFIQERLGILKWAQRESIRIWGSKTSADILHIIASTILITIVVLLFQLHR